MPAVFVKSLTRLEDLPDSDKPHVAMVGRSNVGKSSLVNHLTHQKGLAYVSAAPGRTQTINLYDIDRRFFLVDLPGYGFAKASKEQRGQLAEMLKTYLTEKEQPALVLLIIDARLGPTDLDREMLTNLFRERIPVIMIANKMDKLPKSKAAHILRTLAAEYPHVQLIPHSIVTNKDRGEIWRIIEETVRAA